MAGCSSNQPFPNSSNPGPVTSKHLTFSTWGSAEEIAITKSLIAEFEAQHPDIQVELIHIPDQYYQKLHILIASGLTPDVVFTNSLSFPIYMSQGIFRDLSPDLQKSHALAMKDFYPSALEAFRWKGSRSKSELGAIPRDISNLVIYYNQDLFRKAHLPDPNPQWTWDDFLKTAQVLTVDEDHNGHPEQFGVSFYRTPPLFWLPFIWSAGGQLWDENFSALQIGKPEALAGLQFYADLRNRYHVAPQQIESGSTTMSQLFLQQKIAMLISGRWSVPVLRKQAKFKWDIVPFPQGKNGSRVGIDASGYAISAQSTAPDAAWTLVEFLVSPHAIEKVCESGLIIPADIQASQSNICLNPSSALPPLHANHFIQVISQGVP
ncbi:MAG: sugar ABC transporter substrate-binding protein, partial [Cyanobacteria bacterium]|nr:sugar ABC transporter substrate-binding protein [Cyanobacteriota bacterium]